MRAVGWMLAGILTVTAGAKGDLMQTFKQPSPDARPMVRWWWFGPAVTEAGIRREIAAMRAGGFGGFELQNTYPLQTEGNLKFLSPEHLKMIGVAAGEAKGQGLRMDLTLGSGWPYGGAGLPIELAAGKLRVERGDNPTLRDGEKLIGTFKLKDGSSQSFISSRTRMMVKRPAFGAEGFVLDHLSEPAAKYWLDKVAKPMVEACGTNAPYALFCDSLESYGEDWTDGLLEEFKTRRGYDLTPLLPRMVDDADPAAAELRHDWGMTITEVFNDRFMKPMAAFAKEHGSRFRIQGYGIPAAALSSYLLSDLPEGEGYQWRGYRATRYASSAAHLMGVPVASSETFTWIHHPLFRAVPLDIKAEAHQHFLQGVNQIICHGWPYTPEGMKGPGASFYVGGVFNDRNPWWIVMEDLNRYLTRCSDLLRQGDPANDVLVYLSNHDGWAEFKPGRVELSGNVGDLLKSSSHGRRSVTGPNLVNSILDAGYGIDFVDDGMLAARGRVEGNQLVFGKLKYKAIVLAGVERLPHQTMGMLETFVKGGGILIATRSAPSKSPGYLAKEEDHAAVRAWSDRVIGGKVTPDDLQVGTALKNAMTPDVDLDGGNGVVGFVHRRVGTTELYFLANTSNQELQVKAKFRDRKGKASRLNLMTGECIPLAENFDRVNLKFEPYEAAAVIFDESTSFAKEPEALGNMIELDEGWTLKFKDETQGKAVEKWGSWTGDPARRTYSGVGTYTRMIKAPSLGLLPMGKVMLSLGRGGAVDNRMEVAGNPGFRAGIEPPVGEVAVVWVNGQRAGAVWCPPYEVDVSPFLHAGDNEIRIDVANTAVNALSAEGAWPNYNAEDLVRQFGKRFDVPKAETFSPVKSGLLVPLRLLIYRK